MPEQIIAKRTINHPRSAVWAVLADFPNIADWTRTVSHSVSTTDAPDGVGAGRRCNIGPSGSLEETILEWEPEERMVIKIYDVQKLPVKGSISSFILEEAGPNKTHVTFDANPTFKFGPLGVVLGKLIAGRLLKGNEIILAELEEEVARRAAG